MSRKLVEEMAGADEDFGSKVGQINVADFVQAPTTYQSNSA
jgi:hypothetical protein